MSTLAIWGGAAALYLGFRLWYDGLRRRPMTSAEVDDLMQQAEESGFDRASDLAEIRRFLEKDDGREFVMLNLVKLHPDLVAHPETGEEKPARELVQEYMAAFLPTLLKRGGVPMMQARKVGPYVDSWGVEADP